MSFRGKSIVIETNLLCVYLASWLIGSAFEPRFEECKIHLEHSVGYTSATKRRSDFGVFGTALDHRISQCCRKIGKYSIFLSQLPTEVELGLFGRGCWGRTLLLGKHSFVIVFAKHLRDIAPAFVQRAASCSESEREKCIPLRLCR